MSNQHRRNLNVSARILSEADGLVEYVASDATLDSYNESILVSGWRFDLFAKNSPFVDSHNYWSIEAMLGRVVGARVEGNQLIERVQWAKDIPEHKLATIGWKLTVGGFLKAVSVGFRSEMHVYPGDSAWTSYAKEAGLSEEESKKCRRIFVKQQQLELSACVIGANPAAVAKAFEAGCLREADLAQAGFNEDDMKFITLAGPAMENEATDSLTKMLIQREMSRITSRKISPNGPTKSPSPGKPDGGEMAARQAAERAEFVKQLEALLN